MSGGDAIEAGSRLEVEDIIGYNGAIQCGLHVHPDRQHLVYALGCDLFINSLPDAKVKTHQALSGHNSDVSCIAISKDGRFIATGCKTHMGFKADIIVWDYEAKCEYARFTLHKVKVQALAFSPSCQYLLSIGGSDDESAVIWNLETKEPICGSPSQVKSAGTTKCAAFANCDDYTFVTGGGNIMRIWSLDVVNRKIKPEDVNMAITQRSVNCVVISPDDQYIYCGTETGDIFSVSMKMKILVDINNANTDKKFNFSRGVTSLCYLKENDKGFPQLLAGAGDGTIAVVELCEKKPAKTAKPPKVTRCFKPIKKETMDSEVSAITLRGTGHQFFVGTVHGQIYRFNQSEFKPELLQTSHYGPINDICFAPGVDELFATCSYEDIRVWHTYNSKELLRIKLANKTCHTICFKPDGTCIISGWDDGVIRAFGPQTGKLIWEIKDAHKRGVSSLAYIENSDLLVSGGDEGSVHTWRVQQDSYNEKLFVSTRVESVSEHKGRVSSLRIIGTNICSTAHDGQCIIWNMHGLKRIQAFHANTLFKCACFHPSTTHLITSGTDRKVTYYDYLDGSQVRECEGSKSGSINGMDITEGGDMFVTVGEDRLVKVWKFNEGVVTHVGVGHTGQISKVVISPRQRHIVSVGCDGAIFRWSFPAC